MPKEWTLVDLLLAALPHCECVLLRSPLGTSELRGSALGLKHTEQWITVFEGAPQDSEKGSHLHLRKGLVHAAGVRRTPKRTPMLDFWSGDRPDRPPLSLRFASHRLPPGPALQANVESFQDWIQAHGQDFELGVSAPGPTPPRPVYK
jgi:hypothetical protein